jgi:hypothetical protein
MKSSAFYVCVLLGLAGAVACSKSNPSSPSVSVSSPRPISPNQSTIATGQQPVTLVAGNATSTQSGVTYTFEVATDVNFSSKVQIKSGVAEGSSGQTSVTLDTLTAGRDYFWRAFASVNGVTGLASSVATFTVAPDAPPPPPFQDTQQGRIAAQLYPGGLWPGVQPSAATGVPGSSGQARMSVGWDPNPFDVGFSGVVHAKPTLDELQIFDLMDRGMAPDPAIGWLKTHGYGTAAVFYVLDPLANGAPNWTIGLQWEYMALLGGAWELVHRVGA